MNLLCELKIKERLVPPRNSRFWSGSAALTVVLSDSLKLYCEVFLSQARLTVFDILASLPAMKILQYPRELLFWHDFSFLLDFSFLGDFPRLGTYLGDFLFFARHISHHRRWSSHNLQHMASQHPHSFLDRFGILSFWHTGTLGILSTLNFGTLHFRQAHGSAGTVLATVPVPVLIWSAHTQHTLGTFGRERGITRMTRPDMLLSSLWDSQELWTTRSLIGFHKLQGP